MTRRLQANPDGIIRFLTTREAALRLGVTVNAIKSWIREKELPAMRTPGGHHRIAETDLQAFRMRLVERSRAPASPQARVLIVDDDTALLALLKETIEQLLPDARVATAADGYGALVEVGAFRPEVLVLDVRMPRLDGFEVCRRLKAGRETAGIKILAITAYAEGEVRDQLLAAGADDFLEKPFPIEKFRSRVMSLLERTARR
jgi:excisionase family DNA binding protein